MKTLIIALLILLMAMPVSASATSVGGGLADMYRSLGDWLIIAAYVINNPSEIGDVVNQLWGPEPNC